MSDAIVIPTRPTRWETTTTCRMRMRFPASPPRKSPVPKAAAVIRLSRTAIGARLGADGVGPVDWPTPTEVVRMARRATTGERHRAGTHL